MRQLLLRVPDELHAQLAARAAREGRSVNALANEVLGSAAAIEAEPDLQAELRVRAATHGLLAPITEPSSGLSQGERAELIAANAGTGPFLDEAWQRHREF